MRCHPIYTLSLASANPHINCEKARRADEAIGPPKNRVNRRADYLKNTLSILSYIPLKG